METLKNLKIDIGDVDFVDVENLYQVIKIHYLYFMHQSKIGLQK